MNAFDSETPKLIANDSNLSQKVIEKVEDGNFGHLMTEEAPSDTEDVLEGKEPGKVFVIMMEVLKIWTLTFCHLAWAVLAGAVMSFYRGSNANAPP